MSEDDKALDHNRRLFLELSALGAAGVALNGCAQAVGASPVATAGGAMAGMPGMAASGRDRPEMAMRELGDYPPLPPGAPTSDSDYKNIDIDVQLVEHEMVPGFKIHTLGFNGAVPGPTIRARQGEWLKVTLRNRTDLLHTIHWHGLTVPNSMDGVPYVTQPPVMPGRQYVYRFKAEPYGTHFYHCHWGTLLHMQSGMYGAFIVESDDDPIKERYGYTREYMLTMSAVDTNWIRDELNTMLARMTQRMRLMRQGRLDSWTTAHFDSVEDLIQAMDQGFIPPYMRSRRSQANLPEPNYFTINGKSYPSTEPILIRQGEKIRIRFANAGTVEHYMHLHGHDFDHVCEDGAILPAPVRGNTLRVSPGKTSDIIVEGTNPGVWTFHDHDTRRATNNGLYPGGALTVLAYEDYESSYRPSVALDE
jgi:FtsP/CotA-like multicopper oxidase with cupredoxin domain